MARRGIQSSDVFFSQNVINFFFGYSDPINMFFDKKNKQIGGDLSNISAEMAPLI